MRRNLSMDEALDDARALYADKRPKTRQAHEDACRHLPGGNTRTVLYHGPFPMRAARGEGAYLHDVDGHRYLNLLGEYTAGVFGHSHPAIRRAIDTALDVGLNLGAHNLAEFKLAGLVAKRFEAVEQVRFTNSGTEANLMAISTARHLTGRDKVMVFYGGYHGGLLYFGGGGIPINAPFPYVLGHFNDIERTRALIRENANELACITVEPMLGSSGCIPGDPDFLVMLREEATASGSILIFDEVMTSRFGRGGAHGEYGITPDMIALGKWIGGGMSFGAFGGREELMKIYDPTAPNAMPHAGTFNNNVLSMHAGIAAMTEAFTPDIAERLHETGNAFRNRINSIFETHNVALHASGVGSLMNLHGVTGPLHTIDDIADSDDRAKELLFLDLLERGFYVARRGFIALSSVLTDAELDEFIAALDDVVALRKPLLTQRS
ncbi:MAG: aminotransferase class III-fold pyridoxal phosphate-dependent enzyme [Alphaproteobacteria bacterium]|nr:aminotransferase class III-fold pyridoxal phosphate-dependent enzyme [Alphaproteobacteria bacterium]